MRCQPLLLGCLILSATACDGLVLGPRPDQPTTGPTLPPGAERELPAPSTRAARLSHPEYENTLRDLLGEAQGPGVTGTFVGDATSTTFDNNGAELLVTSDLWADYQRAAEQLAQQASASPEALTRVCGGTLPSDAAGFVRAAGRRVFRRALTDAEAADYEALFAQGAAFFPADEPFASGARVVLEAMLQSPHFLYRLELSTQENRGVIPLTGAELATRLSYALWQSMPDEELLQAAETGALLTADGYTAQVTRLLGDPKARATVRTFHAQLLQVSRFRDITRSTSLFPEFTPALQQSMQEEPLRLVDAVVFDENAGVGRLFTAPYTFVDAPLASVYGLAGTFDATFQKVSFTDGRRGGLLTGIGFLAANATSTESDPIHRGVFINHRVLCANLPSPPNNVPPLPAPDPLVPKTLRQRITDFTGEGTCGAGCHGSLINPIGFAYEHFDALGRWRDEERNGLPIDARDAYYFDGVRREFDGATSLGQVMAEEAMTHRCYAQHWVEFLHGRALAAADAAVVKRVADASRRDELPVREVLRALVESESFRTRAVEP
ncbi:MAG: DUF1592 domain-containing protein [Myxococcota bacterium]